MVAAMSAGELAERRHDVAPARPRLPSGLQKLASAWMEKRRAQRIFALAGRPVLLQTSGSCARPVLRTADVNLGGGSSGQQSSARVRKKTVNLARPQFFGAAAPRFIPGRSRTVEPEAKFRPSIPLTAGPRTPRGAGRWLKYIQ